MTIIISSLLSVVIAVLLWDRYRESRKSVEEIKRLVEINNGLFKRIPVSFSETDPEIQPLTIEKIADAIRLEGYVPEIEEDGVSFKAQGEGYYIDAERLPLIFIVKGYSVDPNDWEMDFLREAAHRMSDALIMVKAGISNDNKSLNYFIAAQDRNYESFRANLTSYLRIIEDGQRKMNDEYHKMVDEKREAALSANPIIPSVKPDNKMMS